MRDYRDGPINPPGSVDDILGPGCQSQSPVCKILRTIQADLAALDRKVSDLVADIAGLRADMQSHSATAKALATLAHAIDRKRAKRADDQLVLDISRLVAAVLAKGPKSGPR
jgi:hypothetical protein